MKLLRAHVIEAGSCGGLLDGFEIEFRRPQADPSFAPFCLIGPNGAGKSQFLQAVAEAFQSVAFACSPAEERVQSNPGLAFELEYEITPDIAGRACPG